MRIPSSSGRRATSARRRRSPCPICREQAAVALVTYVFGSRLPAHGRCVSTASRAGRAQHPDRRLTAYVVEACVECRWHHLLRVLPIGGRASLAHGLSRHPVANARSPRRRGGDAPWPTTGHLHRATDTGLSCPHDDCSQSDLPSTPSARLGRPVRRPVSGTVSSGHGADSARSQRAVAANTAST